MLGRGWTPTVRVESATVSRRHARIVIAPEGVMVEDLGSKNGTCLNGRRLCGPSPLASGDVVSLGSERLTFRTAPASATDDTLSSAEPGARDPDRPTPRRAKPRKLHDSIRTSPAPGGTFPRRPSRTFMNRGSPDRRRAVRATPEGRRVVFSAARPRR